MIVYRTLNDLQKHLDRLRREGRSIGLVPTMGALHEGHASLVDRCVSENEITVVSIFVNPTQFNDPSDLEHYPRTPDKDLSLLQARGATLVFMPSVKEVYPEPDTREFDLGGLDLNMEGALRPGHFKGVAQVVSKLFDMVRPHRAYFGQKDFQQLAIIRHLAASLETGIEIISCPIVREKDGLAMSSRNIRLNKEQRKAAPFIYQSLKLALELKTTRNPLEVKTWMEKRFAGQDLMSLEYFEIVGSRNLRPVSTWKDAARCVGCIAVQLGPVRLIDNVIFD